MSRLARDGRSKHVVSVIAFASLALGTLAASFSYLGRLGLGPSCEYYADFAYAAGLETGAPVKVSGIRVGKVTRLALLGPDAMPPAAKPRAATGLRQAPMLRASLRVTKDVAPYVTAQSLWGVVTTGIIGDAYLELSPGAGEPCAVGSAMRGVDAPHLQHIALATETILEHIAPLFEPVPGPQDASGSAAQASELSPAAKLIEALAHLLQQHEASLGGMLNDGAQAMADARRITEVVRAALGDGASLGRSLGSAAQLARRLEADYPGLQAKGAALLAHLDSVAGRVDGELSQVQLDTWVRRIDVVLKQSAAASTTASTLADGLARGEGTLGRALHDADLYDDLRALLHDLREHPYKLLWRR